MLSATCVEVEHSVFNEHPHSVRHDSELGGLVEVGISDVVAYDLRWYMSGVRKLGSSPADRLIISTLVT